jgi:hypothetical protein
MSDAKLQANRENAKKSTGPRTEEGKQASRANATRHGLRSETLYVPPGEQADFDRLRSDLLDDVQPAGELEGQAFERLVLAAWRMRRVRASEAALLADCEARGVDPFLDDDAERRMKRLEDYHRRAESAYARALRELRELQTNRHICEIAPSYYGRATDPGLSHLPTVDRLFHSHERTQIQRDKLNLARTNPTHRRYDAA